MDGRDGNALHEWECQIVLGHRVQPFWRKKFRVQFALQKVLQPHISAGGKTYF